MEPAVLYSVHNNPSLDAPYAAQSNPYRKSSFHLHLGLLICNLPTSRTTKASWVRFRHVQQIYLFCKSFTPVLEPNRRPVQWVPAALSPGTKQRICEAGRSYPGTYVNRGSHTSTPPHVFVIFTGIRWIWRLNRVAHIKLIIQSFILFN